MHNLVVNGRVGSVQPLKQVGENHVLNFSLASNDYRKEKEQNTTWFSCSIWGDFAQGIAPHIVVGKGLMVTGKLVSDDSGNPKTYETKDGSWKASYTMVVNDLEFTTPKGESKPATSDDDDIPF